MEALAVEITKILNSQNTQESKKSSEVKNNLRPLTTDEMNAVLIRIGVPERYRSAKKSDFDDKIWAATDSYRNGVREGMYIFGKTGVGKSHLAAALIRARVESLRVPADEIGDVVTSRNPEMIWISATDLLLAVKRCFPDGAKA